MPNHRQWQGFVLQASEEEAVLSTPRCVHSQCIGFLEWDRSQGLRTPWDSHSHMPIFIPSLALSFEHLLIESLGWSGKMNPLGTDTRVSSCLGLTQWMNKSWTVPFNLVDCPNSPPQNLIVWNTHLRLLYFLPELSFFPYCQVLETEGLCPTQILMLKPSVQCAGIRRWGFWEVIRIRGHEGEALMHRIRALKRDQRSASFLRSLPCEDTTRRWKSETWKGVLSGTQPRRHLGLVIPAHRNRRNKPLLFIKPPSVWYFVTASKLREDVMYISAIFFYKPHSTILLVLL